MKKHIQRTISRRGSLWSIACILVLCFILPACGKAKKIDEAQAKEITYDELQKIKEETFHTKELFSHDASYTWVGDLGGDFMIYPSLPAFEMKMDSIEDVDFFSAGINETDNAWVINAIVKTTWGEVDSKFNFDWQFFIDLDTGKLQRKPIVDADRSGEQL